MITLDELMAEFERLGVGKLNISPDFRTLLELQSDWNVSKTTAEKILHRARDQGILQVAKKHAQAIDGSMRRVPAYKIVLPKKGKR